MGGVPFQKFDLVKVCTDIDADGSIYLVYSTDSFHKSLYILPLYVGGYFLSTVEGADFAILPRHKKRSCAYADAHKEVNEISDQTGAAKGTPVFL